VKSLLTMAKQAPETLDQLVAKEIESNTPLGQMLLATITQDKLVTMSRTGSGNIHCETTDKSSTSQRNSSTSRSTPVSSQRDLRVAVFVRDNAKCLISGDTMAITTTIAGRKGLKLQEGKDGIASHVVPHAKIERREIPPDISAIFGHDAYHVCSAILLRKDWDYAFGSFYIYIDADLEYQIFYAVTPDVDWVPDGATKGMKLNVPTDPNKIADFPPVACFKWHKEQALQKFEKFSSNPPKSPK